MNLNVDTNFQSMWKNQKEAKTLNIDFSSLEKNLKSALKYSQNVNESNSEHLEVGESFFDLTNLPLIMRKCFWEIGLEMIAENKVAIIIMAGGQGTRLGSKDPKGLYKLGLISGKTLFECFVDKILRLQELSGEIANKKANIPLCIMTSKNTHESTKKFFEDNENFGLEKIFIFQQDSLPCFSVEAKLIFDEHSNLVTSPDGNGTIYRSIDKSGVLSDLKAFGVKFLHVCNIDNVMSRVGDPILHAFSQENNFDVVLKTKKRNPNEKTGKVLTKDGNIFVAEYTAKETNPNSSSEKYVSEGNIGSYCFSLEFFENAKNTSLIHHITKKNQKTPKNTECLKLEKYIFDAFPFATKSCAVRISNNEFAPVKNKNSVGFDSPKTALQLITSRNVKLVKQKGGEILGYEEGNDSICEISGRLSYEGEGLEDIVAGKSFNLPLLLD